MSTQIAKIYDNAFRNNPMPISVYKSFSAQIKEADQQKSAGASATGGRTTVSKSSTGDRDYSWGSRFDRKSKRGMQSKIITKGGHPVVVHCII